MAEEIKKVIKIETGEGERTVKSLKQEISDLRDKLLNLDSTSEEYAANVQKLQQDQRDLNTVMGLSSKGATALEGSYDALQHKLTQLRKEWKATNDEGQRDVLGAQMKAINEQLKGMDESIGNYQRNVGNYKSALDGFAGAVGSVQGAASNFVNGIAAMNGVMALAGGNTLIATEDMQKLQAVIMVLQSTQGLGGLAKSFKDAVNGLKNLFTNTKKQTAETVKATVAEKAQTAAVNEGTAAKGAATVATTALGVAMNALPIFAIITLVTLLVTHIQDIIQWVGKLLNTGARQELEKIRNTNEKLNETLDEQNDKLEFETRVMEAQGRSTREVLEAKKALIVQQRKETQATIDNIKARMEQMKADSAWARFWKGENKQIRAMQKELEELTETMKTLTEAETKAEQDIVIDGIKNETDARKKAAEEAKKQAEAVAAARNKALQDAINASNTEIANLKKEGMTQRQIVDAEYSARQKVLIAGKEAMEQMEGFNAQSSEYLEILSALNASTDLWLEQYKEASITDFDNSLNKTTEDLQKQSEVISDAEMQWRKLDAVIGPLANEDLRDFNKQVSKENLDNLINYKDAIIKLVNDTYKETAGHSPEEWADLVPGAGVGFVEAAKEKLKASQQDIDIAMDEYFRSFFDYYKEGMNDSSKTFGERLSFSQMMDQVFEATAENYGMSPEMQKRVWQWSAEFKKQLAQEAFQSDTATAGERINLFNYLFGGNNFFDDPQWVELDTKLGEIWQALENAIPGTEEYASLSEEYKSLLQDTVNYEAELLATRGQNWQKFGKKMEAFNQNASHYLNSYGAAVSSILDSVAGAWENQLRAQVEAGKKSEEEAKNEFENIKALQYGVTWINTAAAVVSALADPTTPSYWLKAANAAAALATGIAQTIQIANTNFGSTAGMSSTYVAPTPSLREEMPLTYTRNFNTEAEDIELNRPVRAYVVDRDLSDGLAKYNRTGNESTF